MGRPSRSCATLPCTTPVPTSGPPAKRCSRGGPPAPTIAAGRRPPPCDGSVKGAPEGRGPCQPGQLRDDPVGGSRIPTPEGGPRTTCGSRLDVSGAPKGARRDYLLRAASLGVGKIEEAKNPGRQRASMSTQADSFQLVRCIRTTETSETHEAVHPVRPGRFLVEVLTAPDRANVVESFERELADLSDAGSPNIVPVVGLGQLPDGRTAAIWELPGTTLAQWFHRGGSASAEAALGLVAGIAAGLEAAHTRGIAHENVSPDNIFLPDDGNGGIGGVKLGGFGLRWFSRQGPDTADRNPPGHLRRSRRPGRDRRARSGASGDSLVEIQTWQGQRAPAGLVDRTGPERGRRPPVRVDHRVFGGAGAGRSRPCPEGHDGRVRSDQRKLRRA